MRHAGNKSLNVRRFGRDRSGATAVEFAFLAPVLMFMLMGIGGYGGYFWMSHSVQQLANDAARAAIPGTTATERASWPRPPSTPAPAPYS